MLSGGIGPLPGSNQRRPHGVTPLLEIRLLALSPLASCLLASHLLASCSAGGLALALAATYSRTTYGDA
ncbi:MAG TPA: hypothetical protein DDY43_14870 [Synechococcales bacterium UBA10510]|nr:hypothetical protein [Synechococcales bacterium UBA10510]